MNRKLAVGLASLVFVLSAQQTLLARVENEQVRRIAADKIQVTWSDKAPVDIYVSDRPDAATADAMMVSHNNRTGKFDAAAAGRSYFLLKDTKDATFVRVAERVLPLEHGSNFRDLGGYPTADGKHVRWGMLFRSAGTPLLTDDDVARVQALGIKDLLDLRSSEERGLAPTRLNGIRYTAFGYSMAALSAAAANGPTSGIYRAFPTLLAPHLQFLFHALLTQNTPFAFNCSAGQDRTGVTAALVLSALGVPRDVILADYHLSTPSRRPEYEMPKIDPAAFPDNPMAARLAQMRTDPRMSTAQPLYDDKHRSLLEFAFDEIETRWGSVEGYLDKEIGVTTADIAKLRQQYLE